MATESESSNFSFLPKIDFTICPYIGMCKLPKHHFPHKILSCKVVCPEYVTSQQKILDPNDLS
ncbi:hypothetical protein LCGC14_0919230 [marine sediment metagenome]|uniref:Uncharacterized protein n=1 Tax=marine sediment metagenome TaxID=412755 RepID=A0A0F9RA01_9ZZZZ